MVSIARTVAIASLTLASILPGCGSSRQLVRPPSPARISCSDPVPTGAPQHFPSVRVALANILDQHPEMQIVFLGGPERERANPYSSALEIVANEILPEAIDRGITSWLTGFSVNDPGLSFAPDCAGRVGFMAELRERGGTLTSAGEDFGQSIQSFTGGQGGAPVGVYLGGSYQEFCAATQVVGPAVRIYIVDPSSFLSGEPGARSNYPREGANVIRVEGASTYFIFPSPNDFSAAGNSLELPAFPGCMN